MQELGQVDGICSFWEAAQALVATLAERVGLLSHPPGAVENAREKQVGVPCFLTRSLTALNAILCMYQGQGARSVRTDALLTTTHQVLK